MQLIYPADAAAALTPEQLPQRYPWPESGTWVRALMITTLDGSAVGPDGSSKSISSSADQAVFQAVRRSSDAIVVGAQTIRAEEYEPMRVEGAEAADRVARGQRPAPVVVVVSGSLDLPWHLPLWSESTERPVVVTAEQARDEHPDRWSAAHEHADVMALPEVAPGSLVEAVAASGLRRIVCEGGPGLLRDLVASGVVDEADITVAPSMTGTSIAPTTQVMDELAGFRLVQVIEDSGNLMNRYLAEGR